ncbi:hypothetical protein PsYK624_003820 [Phanerochaete sordida]|uniref:Uncharacterized protein n=1 Tax=Phanerochaete sordida TaxID=48140 RepID=A0A9P3FXB1_9APHY|nr:hypothetical protein PsYK624_003820 [Phanerochaete sordida]
MCMGVVNKLALLEVPTAGFSRSHSTTSSMSDRVSGHSCKRCSTESAPDGVRVKSRASRRGISGIGILPQAPVTFASQSPTTTH